MGARAHELCKSFTFKPIYLSDHHKQRGFSNFVLFDTSQYNNNHVQTLNTWQAFCNDTTVWQRNDKGHYYPLECDDPTTCKLARQAADQRNARSNAEEKLGEHTDALMQYNREIEEQQEEIKKNVEEWEIKNARTEAAQKGLATKKRNKDRRD
jgi:predicted RNase H-like HicB family nuclease